MVPGISGLAEKSFYFKVDPTRVALPRSATVARAPRVEPLSAPPKRARERPARAALEGEWRGTAETVWFEGPLLGITPRLGRRPARGREHGRGAALCRTERGFAPSAACVANSVCRERAKTELDRQRHLVSNTPPSRK